MSRQFGALSGLAAVFIVVNHSIFFGTVYPEAWGYPSIEGWGRTILSILQSFGWFAVPIFLFISGSFVSYAAQGDPPRLSSKFMVATLKHIIIPYVIWSVVFYVLVYFYNQETYSLLGYVKQLLVGYPYHFVPLLVFYYILSPILLRIGRSYGVILLIGIALYQLALINILYPGTLGLTFPTWFHYLSPPIIRTTLAEWAIFFPLGLVYGLHQKKVVPWSKKFSLWITIVTVVFFVLGLLDTLKVITFPMARHLAPVTFMFLIPAIKRDSIPLARQLERVGRRTYGIYLTNLIILNLVLIGIRFYIPYLFNVYILLFPFLFVLTLFIPLLIMNAFTKGHFKPAYRYVFG